MTSFYRMKPARSKLIASVPKLFYLNSLVMGLSIAGFSVMSSACAADTVPPATPADGWESPTKLKPYVKLQPDAPATVPSPVSSTPVGTSTVTVKKETVEISTPTDAATSKELDSVVKSIILDSGPDVLRLRKDRKAAKRLANYHWLDKAADANPRIIEAITMHKSAAKILAKHPRLAEVAEADHYTCRRITNYKSAARVLAANGDVKEVAALDPEGLYIAIKRDKKIIKILSRNPIFDQMIVENPDLARVISKYM